MDFIRKLFKRKNHTKPEVIESITSGKVDESNFADVYVNGKKSNIKLLLWDREKVRDLQKIAKEIHTKSSKG